MHIVSSDQFSVGDIDEIFESAARMKKTLATAGGREKLAKKIYCARNNSNSSLALSLNTLWGKKLTRSFYEYLILKIMLLIGIHFGFQIKKISQTTLKKMRESENLSVKKCLMSVLIKSSLNDQGKEI